MIHNSHICFLLLSITVAIWPSHCARAAEDPVVENPDLAIKYDPKNDRLPIEEQLQTVLAQPSELAFKNLPLGELVRLLRQHSGMPIFIDRQSFKAAKIDPMLELEADVAGSSLKGILFAALSPHGLEAVIENDLLLVKTNFDSLARMGGRTTQWVSINDEATESLIDKLGQVFTGNLGQFPLDAAMRHVAAVQDIQIIINTRALEDIGLTRDIPVTLNAKDLTTLAFLQALLRENDLALNVSEGMLEITTMEDAQSEESMLVRAYWLDGTDLKQPEEAAELITTNISPMSWDVVGGAATLKVFRGGSGRSALVINAGFAEHLKIENLLNSLRGLPNRPAKIESSNRPVAPPNNAPAANAVDPFGNGGIDPFGSPPE